VRVDTAVEDGSVVPPYYDSLIAKVIVWDADRPSAIARAGRALGELQIDGVPTTREAALEILATDEFASGDYSTAFLEELYAEVAS
jgi:acetyl-CoA carboxylase biotin carboxylase subunit